jgi:hypothetical protein
VKFTYADYFRFVDDLRLRGYELRHFAHPDSLPSADGRFMLLCHDIDLDLRAALELARREHEHGVQSDYFVLTTSPFYNPAAGPSRAMLREMADLGHGIGLHFDETVYTGHDDTALAADCAAEVATLEAIVNRPLVGVSYHRPARGRIGSDTAITGLPHRYMRFFVEEMEYCSDSAGRWRYGPPTERAAVRDGRALHLLTHPLWWGERDLPPADRLHVILDVRGRERRVDVSREFEVDVRERRRPMAAVLSVPRDGRGDRRLGVGQ